MTQAPRRTGFFCPQCAQQLADYAIQCENCGLDLIANDPLPADTRAKSINRKDRSVFFYVSPLKLVVMCIVTFGIYELFWFYKNWAYVKEHTNGRLWPIVRAIFSGITYYWLLRHISRAGAVQGIKCQYSPVLLAFAYIVLVMASHMPDPFSLVGQLSCLALLPAQSYVNSLNKNSATPINSRFTVANWIFIVIGAQMQVLAIIGMVRPR